MGERKMERETGAGEKKERKRDRDGREKDRETWAGDREIGRETGWERERGEKEKKLQTQKNSWNFNLYFTPQNGVKHDSV